VPELQRLVMADACHLNFGKYTLFSCYGITSNANMCPVGFAIIFGNENLLSWKDFWKFIIEFHPCLNQTDVTIVTDQDKGLFSAITEEVPEAVNFHCSYHRSQNINAVRHPVDSNGCLIPIPFLPLPGKEVWDKDPLLVEADNKVLLKQLIAAHHVILTAASPISRGNPNDDCHHS
jgi:hypothetical protein